MMDKVMMHWSQKAALCLQAWGSFSPGLRLLLNVDEENDLNPDQSQSGPSEETVSPLEGIVELIAHAGVGKYKNHQE